MGKEENREDLLVRFGLYLRSKREELGITSAELARRAGIDRGNYANIESGLKDIQLSTIKKLCKGFGLSSSEFFDGFDFNP